jgi:hypothetical protein
MDKCDECEMSELCDKFDLKKEKESPCPMHRPRKGKKGSSK